MLRIETIGNINRSTMTFIINIRVYNVYNSAYTQCLFYMCECICVYIMYVCMYVYMYMYMYIYIYIYIYICAHMYVCIYGCNPYSELRLFDLNIPSHGILL